MEISEGIEKKIALEVKKKARIKKTIRISYITGGVILLAIVYAFFNRPFKTVINYSLLTSGGVLLLILAIGLSIWGRSGFKKPTKSDIITVLLLPFFVIFIGLFYYSTWVALNDLFDWFKSPSLSRNGAIALAILVTLLLGFSLFYFRLRLRSVYGATEALTGLVVAANRVATEKNTELTKSGFYLAILTASVYLVVRGFDNIHQGLTKDPKDPIALRIYAYFLKREL